MTLLIYEGNLFSLLVIGSNSLKLRLTCSMASGVALLYIVLCPLSQFSTSRLLPLDTGLKLTHPCRVLLISVNAIFNIFMAYLYMVIRRMMFGKIIRFIIPAWLPINFKLALFNSIFDPIETHVYCLWFSLPYIILLVLVSFNVHTGFFQPLVIDN